MSAQAVATTALARARSTWWQRLLRRRGSGLALGLLVLVTLTAVAAPLLPLPGPGELHADRGASAPDARWGRADPVALAQRHEDRPWATGVRVALFGDGEWQAALGTDTLGRDVLARLVWGARVSLAVALLATLVSAVLGVAWGLLSGLLGGRLDQLLMRIVDALDAVPLLMVAILLVAILRDVSAELRAAGIDRLVLLFVVIGALSWLGMARVVRAQVLGLRRRDFVLAARALGVGPLRIAWRHLVPNLVGVITVTLTLNVPRVVLFEAFLSFLGLGVEPPGVSWGILAAEGLASLTVVSVTWWLVVFPSLALASTLMALNTLGDALRDALDPRLSAPRPGA